jgi:hypothetical protein
VIISITFGQGIEGRDQALHHLQPILRPLEGVAGAADQGELAVVEEFLQQLAQGQLDRQQYVTERRT